MLLLRKFVRRKEIRQVKWEKRRRELKRGTKDALDSLEYKWDNKFLKHIRNSHN